MYQPTRADASLRIDPYRREGAGTLGNVKKPLSRRRDTETQRKTQEQKNGNHESTKTTKAKTTKTRRKRDRPFSARLRKGTPWAAASTLLAATRPAREKRKAANSRLPESGES